MSKHSNNRIYLWRDDSLSSALMLLPAIPAKPRTPLFGTTTKTSCAHQEGDERHSDDLTLMATVMQYMITFSNHSPSPSCR